MSKEILVELLFRTSAAGSDGNKTNNDRTKQR